MKYGLEFASAIFALVAAVLWWISARVLIPAGYPLGLALKQSNSPAAS
jgi:hypothetical protein